MEREFMARAIDLGRVHMRSGEGGPFGAVVVKGGEIVAEGYNEVLSSKDPTAHAEVVAIRRAAARLESVHLEGCEIYASCEPCPMCLGAIYWARIETIWFACTAEDAGEIGFDDKIMHQEMQRPPVDRRIPSRQLLRHDALAVFREWREKEDRVEY